MTTHYLRVEGVNFADFLYDTSDLSTIRGGSLALLRVGFEVEEQIKSIVGADQVERIQVGASSGLFGLNLTGPSTPSDILRQLRNWQRNHPLLSHASLVTDMVDSSKGFAFALQALLALNRARQLQSPSLKLVPSKATNDGPCGYTNIRPATNYINAAGGAELACDSVKARRQEGQVLRQKFYEIESERPFQGDFVGNFEELASHPPAGCRHLAGKLALIYIDANSMGSHFDARASSKDRYAELARWQLEQRRVLLRQLVDFISNDSAWKTADTSKRFRLEVLLWGGDEMLIVAPAWRGWSLLEWLGSQLACLRLPGEKDLPLYHAAAMILANHKAPIHSLRRLARNLADEAKETSRQRHLAMVEVLENFDHVGPELAEHYSRTFPDWLKVQDMALPLDRLKEINDCMVALKMGGIGRRQYHRLAGDIAMARTKEEALGLVRSLTDDFPSIENSVKEMIRFCDGPQALFHLCQLWEYVSPEL